MDWFNLLKKSSKGGGWIAIAAGVLMFISKQLGLPVTEEFWISVLGLLAGGTAGVVGAKFMPDGLPVMSGNERATWEAWWLLDQVLSDDPQARTHLDGLQDSMAKHYRVSRPESKKKPNTTDIKRLIAAELSAAKTEVSK